MSYRAQALIERVEQETWTTTPITELGEAQDAIGERVVEAVDAERGIYLVDLPDAQAAYLVEEGVVEWRPFVDVLVTAETA